MYCKNCGKEMNDNQAICLNCGVKTGAGTGFCANCGNALPEGAEVCLNCGVAVKGAGNGEYLNGKILAKYLGYDFIDAANVIFFKMDGTFDSEKTNEVLSEVLKDHTHAVIPGFYGSMPNDTIKTFSRGGSDITGSIVARAAKVTLYENWTDVSGFMMADPRIIKNPKTIEYITYRELRELSYMGATVLHEDAVFPVRIMGIPINIKNTNAPDDKGTMIVSEAPAEARGSVITGIAGKKNFSIVRPSITFSKSRFQLTTLEASIVIYRMKTGKTVILPACAMDVEATMTWAGDTARMFAAVIGNEKAFGETYTFATAEHHPWREVAEIYAKLGGLKYITVSEEDYLELISPKKDGWQHYARQQLRYDRCFHRVVDNSKILSLMGETQEDLTPLAEGLRRELAGVTLDMIPEDPIINARMDGYLLAKGIR